MTENMPDDQAISQNAIEIIDLDASEDEISHESKAAGTKKRWHGWSRSIDDNEANAAKRPCNEDKVVPCVRASEKAMHAEAVNAASDIKPQSETVEEFAKLTYWIPMGVQQGRFWTHEPYRNSSGEKVQVHYCTDFETSERHAKTFLDCPVVGFDMEWCPRAVRGIKGNISVIQVACEEKIGIFHIALHDGRTVEQLLPPSLRKLIEDVNILKCGVAINNADGSRLRRYMRLEPRGMFELSFLQRLVNWAKRDPSKVIKRLIALSSLVHGNLGKPLFKGKVRTSDWTKKLSEEQIKYAAADAYAGFRLFHALETKRLKLPEPRPPRPAPAELQLPLRVSDMETDEQAANRDSLQHQSSEGTTGKGATAAATVQTSKTSASTHKFKMPSIEHLTADDPNTRRAYSALRALRKRLSLKLKQPEEVLTADSTLYSLASKRPRKPEDLEGRISEKRWAQFVSMHAGLNLLAFIAKHCPEPSGQDGIPEEEKENRQPNAGESEDETSTDNDDFEPLVTSFTENSTSAASAPRVISSPSRARPVRRF